MERYLPHTSDDDDTRYRPKEEIEEARKSDPIKFFREYLLSQGVLTEALDEEFSNAAKKEIDQATEIAEAAPYPEPDDFYQHLFQDSGA